MFVLYVSGHGYGHATREAAVVAALRALRPDLAVEVRTHAPAWIFTESSPGVAVSRGGPDPGMTQMDALDIDLPASLRAHQELGARWDALVAEEAAWLKGKGARLVAADVTPLAFAAAAAAGVPSVGVSNFCWDWIMEEYEADAPAWRPVHERYAQAYRSAEAVYRLPMHGDFPSFKKIIDVPLVSRIATADANWKKARGFAGAKPLVLLAFGGFGVELSFDAGDDLIDLEFCGFGAKPKGLHARWTPLRSGTSADQLQAMASCDVVVCKPGYGMFSEAMAHGKRVLYVPRSGFREIHPLMRGLEGRGACAAIGRLDFAAGRWRKLLDRLLDREAPVPVAAVGAEVVARALLERLS